AMSKYLTSELSIAARAARYINGNDITAQAITTAVALKRTSRGRNCRRTKPTAVGGNTNGNSAAASRIVRIFECARHVSAARIVANGATNSVLMVATRSVNPTIS